LPFVHVFICNQLDWVDIKLIFKECFALFIPPFKVVLSASGFTHTGLQAGGTKIKRKTGFTIKGRIRIRNLGN
jgi:hypothetical protein